MKILLIRHGKPNVTYPDKIYANEMKRMIDEYNEIGLSASEQPPAHLFSLVSDCNFVVCSHLKRSLDSATALNLAPDLVDSLFRELELPYPNKRYIRLSPFAWSTLLRILWFLGYSHHSESYLQSKKRCHRAAMKLIDLSQRYESIVLIGHGFSNRFISRVLRLKGWEGPLFSGRNFWSDARYEK